MSDGKIHHEKSVTGVQRPDPKPKVMDERGAIGKQFTGDGNIGQVGNMVGGPLAEDGIIGKEFTAQGTVGGTIQDKMGGEKKA